MRLQTGFVQKLLRGQREVDAISADMGDATKSAPRGGKELRRERRQVHIGQDFLPKAKADPEGAVPGYTKPQIKPRTGVGITGGGTILESTKQKGLGPRRTGLPRGDKLARQIVIAR